MNRITWSITLVFGAVIVLYLPTFLQDNQKAVSVENDGILVPNYQAVKLNSMLYDESGKLSHQVLADKMEHYQELGFTIFENPVYTIYLDDGEPWQVTASEGTLHSNKRIQLEKNVKIVNLRSQEFVKEIKTQYIEIDLQDKTLSSDQIVSISGTNYMVTSLGIFGNLSTQQYELKDHVQTQFDPLNESLQ